MRLPASAHALIILIFFAFSLYILNMQYRQSLSPGLVAAWATTLVGICHAGASSSTTPIGGGGSNSSSTPFNGTCTAATNVSTAWHAPAPWAVSDLATVINGTGTNGMIFNTSQGPLDTYDWCNMPHTNRATYVTPSADYKLEYVEVIHRHHKRTPYGSNAFPVESYAWQCDDAGIAYGGKPIAPTGNGSVASYWNVYQSPTNPLAVSGAFNGSCQFPQLTRGGLNDAWQHGQDLKEVYHDLLGFLPKDYDAGAVSYRVTNNVITSQVAAMLVEGMYPGQQNQDIPLLIQPNSVDGLAPGYSCPDASNLFSSFATNSNNANWTAHLTAAQPLFAKLDAVSGVSSSNWGWHRSFDHYFDNLSARQCDAKPLPCNIANPALCITQAMADAVYRLGEYEYSYTFRGAPPSLAASTASFGIWMAELATNLRAAMGESPNAVGAAAPASVRYRHNVAHDDSLSRLLSIMQVEKMFWPGMGTEVVYELYSNKGCYFLRVLQGGVVMQSSHPAFGALDMLPVDTFLSYIDALVGRDASKVPGLCYS